MAARKKNSQDEKTPVVDYRHQTKRKNIPPAGLAAQGKVSQAPKLEFAYNPHLPPILRSDPAAESDQLPELLRQACARPLVKKEARLLAEALRNHEPWLEWTGKREKKGFEVDPVALHIHERISAQAILKVAARESVQRDLFADPQLEYQKAVQFYQYDMDWANRMILGDSLQVMASLTRRETLAGKVQMIYVDPPYGIKFASNFQPEIGKRDVKDKENDLTREPEMVKAYRDTWTLGVHSYLAYLRDRLMLCKELLADTGSIFVQISDENLHRVRSVLDEIFEPESFVSIIAFKKTGGFETVGLAGICDYLLWYAKSKGTAKINTLFESKILGEGSGERYSSVLLQDGSTVPLSKFEANGGYNLPDGSRVFLGGPLTSDGAAKTPQVFEFQGVKFLHKSNQHWKTTPDGLQCLGKAERIFRTKDFLNYRLFLDDFPASPITNMWTDTMGTAERDKVYVVQTTTKIIERCLLMTTDPGDLVLDPTCGSGTTAYVAEQWGRRWITIDTSRVALALARQRLLTAKFDYHKLRPLNAGDLERNPQGPWLSVPAKEIEGKCTFQCKTVPHIMLKSIAQNVALDAIFAKHAPMLDAKLQALNGALSRVTTELRQRLAAKLLEKEKRVGRKSITDADRRRWQLPTQEWKEWEVPFDADDEWPTQLKSALAEYREVWRSKMDEVNACIAASAEQEELVDKPEFERNVVRVSGPFTMEAVMPAEESLEVDTPIGGEPEKLETFEPSESVVNAEAYLDKMRRLLEADGVRFPNNKVIKFSRLEPIQGEFLHAEGEWVVNGDGVQCVAVSFGPQFGPVTAWQVENALHAASKRGYDAIVFAGFSFDAAAQGAIQEDPNPRVRCHLAHIRPDVNMGELLKETPNAQIFTVFGTPRTELRTAADGMFEIELQGVDIYNPVDNSILATNADKVAAWFLDSDYDAQTFCITQAFFPDKTAWSKLANALKGTIDDERFAALSGTRSLPFPAGKHKRAAVKVIDPRGNEVMRVHRLEVV